MKDDQLIRGAGILGLTVVLVARLVVVGNGELPFLGFDVTPFGLYVVAVVILALPETIDMLPFGPTRK
jgi:hypothetical protein